MILKLVNSVLVAILHVERRFEPFLRPQFDAIFREPAANLIQYFINRKRKDEGLKMRKARFRVKTPRSIRSSTAWAPICAGIINLGCTNAPGIRRPMVLCAAK